MTQSSVPEYTWDDIKKHNKDTDCWVVLYDKVLDVTAFLNEHPGGLDPIYDMAGEDITNQFETIGHTSTALSRSKAFIVGKLDPKCKKVSLKAAPTTSAPKWSEMSKEDMRKYKAGGEIVPMWVIALVVAVVIAIILYCLA